MEKGYVTVEHLYVFKCSIAGEKLCRLYGKTVCEKHE